MDLTYTPMFIFAVDPLFIIIIIHTEPFTLKEHNHHQLSPSTRFCFKGASECMLSSVTILCSTDRARMLGRFCSFFYWIQTTITADLKLLSFLVLILSRIFLISTLLTLLLLSNKFWYNYENINIIVNYIKSQ